ncbi:MAG: hypothetical protein P9L89_04750 [Candidatus Celaenobacter polaris]|nr:hypothetical protein [Candidatus Celaenobacter polaris]
MKRKKIILEKAYEYAKSGEFNDWHHIEIQLKAEGYLETRKFLDGDFIRKELDDLCKQAKEKTNE